MADHIEVVSDHIQYMPPNWGGVAFNKLSPLVTEARAFLLNGDIERAKQSLDEARKCIVQSTRVFVAVTRELPVNDIQEDSEPRTRN